MNEFKPQVETPISATRPPPPPKAKGQLNWVTKPLIAGLSLPWLVGVFFVVLGAGWWLFAPEKTSTIQQLAFEDAAMQPVAADPKPLPPKRLPADTGFEMPQPKLAGMEELAAIRSYSEANRTAIERMVENYKVEAKNVAALQQQISELQAQLSLLSARLPAEGGSGSTAAPRAKGVVKPKGNSPSSPVSEMRLSAIQSGMAWVKWQDKTWAMQVGDTFLGTAVTVTGIDASSRQVRTTAGTIE